MRSISRGHITPFDTQPDGPPRNNTLNKSKALNHSDSNVLQPFRSTSRKIINNSPSNSRPGSPTKSPALKIQKPIPKKKKPIEKTDSAQKPNKIVLKLVRDTITKSQVAVEHVPKKSWPSQPQVISVYENRGSSKTLIVPVQPSVYTPSPQ